MGELLEKIESYLLLLCIGLLLKCSHERILDSENETPRASFESTRGSFQQQLWQRASEHSG